VCEHYTTLKRDYLYRGDVLTAVPFISHDAGEIRVEAPPPPKGQPAYTQPAFIPESESTKRQGAIACVAQLERLHGVVLLRTCEANKRTHRLKVPPAVLVAPIRPFDDFGIDKTTNRPFHELILEGFPANDPTEEPGQCYRFMVLPPCAEHGIPDGGIVCFREAQPVPIRHLLACEKLTRLSIESVNVLDFRYGTYMQQQAEDNVADSAPEGEDSTVVAAFKKRLVKQAERVESASEAT